MILRISAAALTAALALTISPVAAQKQGAMAGKHLTIPMKALNDSNETGTATLTDTAHGLVVTMALSGNPAATKGVQPAHIHDGSCGPTLDPKPEYPLHPVVNGGSTTTLPKLTIAKLLASKYAINVHDPKDMSKYLSCGNVRGGNAMMKMKMKK